MVKRRDFLVTGAGMLALVACGGGGEPAPEPEDDIDARSRFNGPARLAMLEREAGGTLGVYILDTGSGGGFGRRASERFGMLSTFKLSLAAMVLRMADGGEADLAEQLAWEETELLAHSPFTTQRIGEGASVRELARAAVVQSDNTAANVLLRRFGGPAALTAFWRDIGDETSRLDRTEPQLNNVPESETRDTTTPAAMASTLAKLATGDVLADTSRRTLLGWMAESGTGKNRLRADLPEGWSGGDKTGTARWPGVRALYADIAVLDPPGGGSPIVVAAYYRAARQHDAVEPDAEAVLATVGRIAADWQVIHRPG